MFPPIVPRFLTAGSPTIAQRIRERVAAFCGRRELGMGRERADADLISLSRDAPQFRDPSDVDQGRRRRQAQLSSGNRLWPPARSFAPGCAASS